jgi:hypothetical protein
MIHSLGNAQARDTFCVACGLSTRNGYIRDTDEAPREAQGAGATPTTRSEAAGCGTLAGGGRAAAGRFAPNSGALGEAAPARRTRGAASGACQRSCRCAGRPAESRW